MLGLLGYLFPAELCELLEGLEGFGGFEAWQTAALNAYKKPLQRPEGAFSLRSYANVWRVLEGFGGFEAWQTAALNAYKKPLQRPEGAVEPLLWPCGGFCVREWRVLGLLGYLVPAELCELLERLEGFGGFEAWQTAALNAYKKPLLRPEGALEPLLWPCGGFCVREWRVLGLLGYLFPAELCELLERLEGFGGFEAWQTAALNAYKKPLLRPEGALEPLLWPCGGFCVREWRVLGLLGYLFPAELCELLEGLEGFGGFEAWQTAALNAYIRSHCSGRKVPLSHCCGLVVAFACEHGAWRACWVTLSLRSWANFWRVWSVWRVLEGFGGFEAWQTAALNA